MDRVVAAEAQLFRAPAGVTREAVVDRDHVKFAVCSLPVRERRAVASLGQTLGAASRSERGAPPLSRMTSSMPERADLLEPVDEAGVWGSGLDSALQGPYELADGARTLRKGTYVENDDAGVVLAVGLVFPVQGEEVIAVVRDDGSPLLLAPLEEGFVRARAQVGVLCDGNHVVAPVS